MNNYTKELFESIKQNTAWDVARLGKFTGSRLGDLFTQPKTKAAQEAGEWSKTAENYILSKVMEIVTGQSQDGASSAAIEHGNEWEEINSENLANSKTKNQDPEEQVQARMDSLMMVIMTLCDCVGAVDESNAPNQYEVKMKIVDKISDLIDKIEY